MTRLLHTAGVLGLLALAPMATAKTGAVATAKVAGKVVVYKDGKPLDEVPPDVYVYVYDGVDPPDTKHPSTEIAQIKKQFEPHLRVVPVGTEVFFPNKDKIDHSVYSTDPEYMNLGRDTAPNKSFVFDYAGEVDIYCDIHPEMAAKVKVMPSSRFVPVAADGSYSIDVPLGKHRIAAWMPDIKDGKDVVKRITVTAADNADVNFKVTAGEPKKSHLNKAGKSYPRDRYKP